MPASARRVAEKNMVDEYSDGGRYETVLQINTVELGEMALPWCLEEDLQGELLCATIN